MGPAATRRGARASWWRHLTLMWSSGGAYNAWADYLELWAAGESPDDSQLPKLEPGDFTVDTWQRFGDRLVEAVSRRLHTWSAALSHAVGATSDEFSVGRALSQSREGLRSVRRLAAHPSLEPELRGKIARLVDDQIRDAQRLLEEQVNRISHDGADLRRRTIRDNPLTAVLSEPVTTPGSSSLSPGWLTEPGARTVRRIIVD